MGEDDLIASMAVEMESAKVEKLTGEFKMVGKLAADGRVVGT